MIPPYTTDNRLDPEAVDRMVEFYASAGCQGLFAVCQSSGMFCPFFAGHMSLKNFFRTFAAKNAGNIHKAVIYYGGISTVRREKLWIASNATSAWQRWPSC